MSLEYRGTSLLVNTQPRARYGSDAALTRAINKALDNANIVRANGMYNGGCKVRKYTTGIAVLSVVYGFRSTGGQPLALVQEAGAALVAAGFTVAQRVYFKNGKVYSTELLQIAAE